MKRIYIIIIAGVLLIGILIGVKKFSADEGVKVSTEKASRRTIIETVSANGKIQPEVEVKLSPDVSGEIVDLQVKEGDKVKKGDLLLRIKPDIYVSALERMEASLNTSRANLLNVKARLSQVKANFANAESSFNRNKKLFDKGAISQSDFDAAKASYEGAKADVQAAEESVKASEFTVNSSEASLKEANENLAKTSVYAPMDGTVSKLVVERGERVVGTTQMTGTELLRIANLSVMEASVEVNENDIVRVSVGDTALVEVDAYLGRKFKGLVTEMANSANVAGTNADQVTNFTVKVRLLRESYTDLLKDKTDSVSPFRPGMSATVDIQTNRVVNTVSVPIKAVTTRVDSVQDQKDNEQGSGDLEVKSNRDVREKPKKENYNKPEECVFIYKDGRAIQVKVKTGIQDDNYFEILSGIEDGAEVITDPYAAVSRTLKDSTVVVKVERDELFGKKGNKK